MVAVIVTITSQDVVIFTCGLPYRSAIARCYIPSDFCRAGGIYHRYSFSNLLWQVSMLKSEDCGEHCHLWEFQSSGFHFQFLLLSSFARCSLCTGQIKFICLLPGI